MTKIPPHSIETSEAGEDIFSYYRSFFKVKNLHDAGIITIKASSTYVYGDSNRSDISSLIRGDDSTRWVSNFEENASFTINFHSNYVALSSYSIYTGKGFRYMKSWDVLGISKGRRYLIDRRNEEDFSNGKIFNQYNFKTYTCQYPGFFNKFIFILTGPDSLGDNILSLSYLKFFGIVTSNHVSESNQNRCNNKNHIGKSILIFE